jgi:hypothetical protein
LFLCAIVCPSTLFFTSPTILSLRFLPLVLLQFDLPLLPRLVDRFLFRFALPTTPVCLTPSAFGSVVSPWSISIPLLIIPALVWKRPVVSGLARRASPPTSNFERGGRLADGSKEPRGQSP